MENRGAAPHPNLTNGERESRSPEHPGPPPRQPVDVTASRHEDPYAARDTGHALSEINTSPRRHGRGEILTTAQRAPDAACRLQTPANGCTTPMPALVHGLSPLLSVSTQGEMVYPCLPHFPEHTLPLDRFVSLILSVLLCRVSC